MEQTGIQLEFTSGPDSIPAASSAPAITDLQLIISSKSPTLIVDLDLMIINLIFLVASTLVSMKTPLRLLSVFSISLIVAPMMPSMIVTTKITETSPSRLTRSSGVIEVEKEFMVEMIDTFYKSLKRCIYLVLKGSTSLFEFLKAVLIQNVETIRDFGGTDQAASLKLIVKDLKKDVDEWHRLNSTDLTPFIEEELKRLSKHMQKTYIETQKEMKAESQELKSLEAKKVKIIDTIDSSNNALDDANEQLEKAEAKIKRANFLISKAGQVRMRRLLS